MSNQAQRQRGFGRQKPGPWARVDGSHPLRPANAWLFNERGGTAIYDVLGKNKGTLNAGGGTNGWSAGPLGLTPDMIGGATGQYVSLASLITTAKVSLSFAAWFVPQAASQFALIFSNGSFASSNDWSLTQQDGTGVAGSKLCLLLDGVSFDATTTATSLTAGVPYFAAVTVNSANLWTLYVNGVKDSSATATALTPAVGSAIGASNGGASPFNGDIGYAAFWARTLSAAEVLQLYQEPYGWLAQPAPRRAFFGPGGAAGQPWTWVPAIGPVLAQ